MPIYKESVVESTEVKIIRINDGTKYLLLKPTLYHNTYKGYSLDRYLPHLKSFVDGSIPIVIEIVNEENKEYRIIDNLGKLK